MIEKTEHEAAHEKLMDELHRLIEPICEGSGLDLVEVQFRREQRGWILRVVIHRPEGVTIDDCSNISHEVSLLLDAEDLIPRAYHLEVSSPGLDWPLKTERDFNRYREQPARLIVRRENATEAIIGRIIEAMDGNVTLENAEGRHTIALASIAKARLVIEF